MLPDIDKVSAVIAEAAAIEIVPRFGKLAAHDIREKAPNDLVTVADIGMERRLTPALAALLPGSVVLGEEAAAADAAVHDLVDGEAAVWIVDPVDGTANFAAAKPAIAVIVALARGGETIAAWIHDPLDGVTATAEQGGGAWRGGERLRAAAPQSPEAMRGSLNLRYFPAEMRQRMEPGAERLQRATPLFCAGQEYLRLAAGALDFALFWRILPWDHAAGVLLHAEAGGFSARLDGSRYRPVHREGGLLIAPDRESWSGIRSVLLGS